MKHLITLSLLIILAACQSQTEQSNTPTQNENDKPLVQDSSIDDPVGSSNVTIVHNASIYTVDSAQPTVEAFAYQDKRISAVGSLDELAEKFPAAKKINMIGATIVPGFIDAHGHLLGLGQSLIIADLMGTASKEEIIEVLKQKASSLSDCLLYTSPSPRDLSTSRMPSSA